MVWYIVLIYYGVILALIMSVFLKLFRKILKTTGELFKDSIFNCYQQLLANKK